MTHGSDTVTSKHLSSSAAYLGSRNGPKRRGASSHPCYRLEAQRATGVGEGWGGGGGAQSPMLPCSGAKKNTGIFFGKKAKRTDVRQWRPYCCKKNRQTRKSTAKGNYYKLISELRNLSYGKRLI